MIFKSRHTDIKSVYIFRTDIQTFGYWYIDMKENTFLKFLILSSVVHFLANFRDQCCRGAIQWRHHRPTGLQYSRDYLPSK